MPRSDARFIVASSAVMAARRRHLSGRRVVALVSVLAAFAVAIVWFLGDRRHSDAANDGRSGATSPGDVHTAPPCSMSSKLVPSCGVIWGVATNPNTADQLATVQQGISRRFDMVYRFHDLDDQIPTDDERALVAAGRILHVSIDSRIFQPPHRTVPWAAVAAGAYDVQLSRQARGIASLRTPVFVTFDHEADQPTRTGPAADFIAAWRHVHDLYAREGATNAVWVWVAMGYEPTFARAGRLWPGNDVVDWISWEAYNSSGCMGGTVDRAQLRTFAASVLPFYRWLKANGSRSDIDIAKPMIISEAGSVVYPTAPQATGNWYTAIPQVLAEYPQIHGIGLWDRPGSVRTCHFQFDHSPVVREAVSEMSRRLPILRK